MPTLTAHGLQIAPPRGWDAQIFTRAADPRAVAPGPPTGPGTNLPSQVVETVPPIAHLANFALPPDRGDFGGGAVELMGSGGIFIALLEHAAAEADTPMFRGRTVPWPLSADDFGPENLQRGIAGQSGLQRWFVAGGRPFCLYVVIGSHRQRNALVREVNQVLASVRIG